MCCFVALPPAGIFLGVSNRSRLLKTKPCANQFQSSWARQISSPRTPLFYTCDRTHNTNKNGRHLEFFDEYVLVPLPHPPSPSPAMECVVGESQYLSYLVDTLATYPEYGPQSLLAPVPLPTEDVHASVSTDPSTPLPSVSVAEISTLVRQWQTLLASDEAATGVDRLESTVLSHSEELLTHLAADVATSDSAGTGPAVSSRREEGEAAAVQLLTPLLQHVAQSAQRVTSVTSSSLALTAHNHCPRAHRWYTRLVPLALHVVVRPLNVAGSSVNDDRESWPRQVWEQYVTNARVQQLLSSFIGSTVEPREKELRFHFRTGEETAKPNEPQHFFSFLLQLFSRLSADTRHGWEGGGRCGEKRDASDLLQQVGQWSLATTATAVFSDCYGWYIGSPVLHKAEFTVVSLNALFEFMQESDGRLAPSVRKAMGEWLAFPSAFATYLSTGCQVAQRALRLGDRALWRRNFLSSSEVGERVFYHRTVHFIRSVEALLRRACGLPLMQSAWYLSAVREQLLQPVLAAYVRAAQMAEVEAEKRRPWGDLAALQEVVVGCYTTLVASEDWLGLLVEGKEAGVHGGGAVGSASKVTRPASSAAAVNRMPALDELVVFRDTLTRRSAAEAQERVERLCRPDGGRGGPHLEQLRDVDAFLHALHQLPDGSSRSILEAAMASAFQRELPVDELNELNEYASAANLARLAALLVSIHC